MTTSSSTTGSNPTGTLLSDIADVTDVLVDTGKGLDDGKLPLAAASDAITKKIVGVANSTVRKAALGPLGILEPIVGPALEKIDEAIPRDLNRDQPDTSTQDKPPLIVQFISDQLHKEETPLIFQVFEGLDPNSEQSKQQVQLAQRMTQFYRDCFHACACPAEAVVEGKITAKGTEVLIDAIGMVPEETQKKLGLDLVAADLRANTSSDPQRLISTLFQGAASTTGNAFLLLGQTLDDAFKRFSDKCEADRKKYENAPPGQKYGDSLVNSTSEGLSVRQDTVVLTNIPVPDLVSQATPANVPVTGGKEGEGGAPQLHEVEQKNAPPTASQDGVAGSAKQFFDATRASVEKAVEEEANTIPALVDKPPEIPSANTWTFTISPAYLSEARLYAQKLDAYARYGMSREDFNDNLKWYRRRLANLEGNVQSVDPDILLGLQKERVENAGSELQKERDEHARTSRNALNVDRAEFKFIAELEFYDRLVVKQQSLPKEAPPVTGAVYLRQVDAAISARAAQHRADKHADPHGFTNKVEIAGKGVLHAVGIGRDTDVIAEDELFIAKAFGVEAERLDNIIKDSRSPMRGFTSEEREFGWNHEHIKAQISFYKTKGQEQQAAMKGVDLDGQIAQQREVVKAVEAAYKAADAEVPVHHDKKKRNELFCQYIAEVDLLAGLEWKKKESSSSAQSATGDATKNLTEKAAESPSSSAPKKDTQADKDKKEPAPQNNGTTDPKGPPGGQGKGDSDSKNGGAAEQKKDTPPPATSQKEEPAKDQQKETEQKKETPPPATSQKEEPAKEQQKGIDLKKMPDIKTAEAKADLSPLRSLGAIGSSSSSSSSPSVSMPSRFPTSFDSRSGSLTMETPFRPREARLMNAQSTISDLFGHGPELPGRFESHSGGRVTFKFDNPQKSRFTFQRSMNDPSSHYSTETLRRIDPPRPSSAPQPTSSSSSSSSSSSDRPLSDSDRNFLASMPHEEGHPPIFVQKGLCFFLEKTQDGIIGTYNRFSKKEFDHDEKVRTHLSKLVQVESQLPKMSGPPSGSPLWILENRPLVGPAREALQKDLYLSIVESRKQAAANAAEVCRLERELHERKEQQTEKYRVIVRHERGMYRDELTTSRTFTPQFLDEVELYFRTYEQCVADQLKELKAKEDEIKKKIIDPEIHALARTLSARLQREVNHHTLYAKGVQQLVSGTYSLTPDAEAFKTLARLYIHEFVDTIQNGLLKEEFLRTENGRQFREDLWKAYTDLKEKEGMVVAAEQEHAQMGWGWRALDYIKGTPKIAQSQKDLKSSEELVVKHMKQIHLNILEQELEKTAENDPLVESKKGLLSLLKGEPADPRRGFIDTALLPALGRRPLYTPQAAAAAAGETPDERKWLKIGVPQTLLFGACENPESLAAKLIAFEWH